MIKWKRLLSMKNMKIPGNIWAPALMGALLGITTVLFIKLPVAPRTVPTSEENISGKNESLEVLLVLPDGEELHLKVTGESTMEVVQSLKMMLPDSGRIILTEPF